MIYKVTYKHDNGCREDNKVAIISSEKMLRTNEEVKDFLYRYVYWKDDDFIQIIEYEPVWNDCGNCILIEKVED